MHLMYKINKMLLMF